jgi:hypothetical protein
MFVMPVNIGVTGIVSKGLKMPGNNTRTTFNRAAVLGTSHIIRKVLQVVGFTIGSREVPGKRKHVIR